jgi:hypothetical protein
MDYLSFYRTVYDVCIVGVLMPDIRYWTINMNSTSQGPPCGTSHEGVVEMILCGQFALPKLCIICIQEHIHRALAVTLVLLDACVTRY